MVAARGSLTPRAKPVTDHGWHGGEAQIKLNQGRLQEKISLTSANTGGPCSRRRSASVSSFSKCATTLAKVKPNLPNVREVLQMPAKRSRMWMGHSSEPPRSEDTGVAAAGVSLKRWMRAVRLVAELRSLASCSRHRLLQYGAREPHVMSSGLSVRVQVLLVQCLSEAEGRSGVARDRLEACPRATEYL